MKREKMFRIMYLNVIMENTRDHKCVGSGASLSNTAAADSWGGLNYNKLKAKDSVSLLY